MSSARSQTDSRKMRVLGVDPAAAGPTGYAVVEAGEGALRALCFGVLRHPARAAFPARLREIHRVIAELLEEFSPDAVAVESVFAAPNLRTALKLAEVRGVVLLAAAQADLPANSYSPREVKAGVAGYGAATKQQMQRMVGALLRLRQPPESPDAADALAVALCHVFAAQARVRMDRATPTQSGASSRRGGRSAGAVLRPGSGRSSQTGSAGVQTTDRPPTTQRPPRIEAVR